MAPRSGNSCLSGSCPAAPRPTASPTQNDSDPFKDLGRARRHGRAADVPAAPAAPIWPTEADYPIVRSPVSFAATGQPMVLGHIQRRQFIALLGGAAAPLLLWPRAARAQQPSMPVVGFLGGPSLADPKPVLTAVRQTLTEFGFGDCQDVAVEHRSAAGQ